MLTDDIPWQLDRVAGDSGDLVGSLIVLNEFEWLNMALLSVIPEREYAAGLLSVSLVTVQV
jgi:hypothetical protein